ncbi:MAG: hypothetical protein QY311_01220 [Candidatus Paceibacterota bacterium]|nr:MAG: hypothetical protein QY311_01220 [Candidatus Paceibacterota bacterium]
MISLRQRIVISVVGALLVIAMLVPVAPDADTWFHLRIGEELLQQGSFIRTESFSFSRFGAAWENHEWLFQAVAALVWRIGEWPLVAWFSAFCGAAVLALSWRGGRLSGHTALLFVLVAGALTPFITPRPQLFAYLGLAGMLFVLERLFAHASWRWGALLVGTLFFWANTHASIILALGVGLAFILDTVWGNLSHVSSRTKTILFSSLGVGFLATLANPLGASIYTYALQPLRQTGVFAALLETMPLTAHMGTSQGVFIFVMHIVLGALALWYAFRSENRAFRTLGLSVGFWLMPWVSMKYIPFAWLVLLPMALRAMTHLRVLVRWEWVCAACAICVVLFFGWRAGAGLRDPYAVWPRDLIHFADTHVPGDARMYHTMTWGNYMLAHYPERNVFLWGGCECFYDGPLQDSVAFAQGERVDEILERYQFTSALVRPWESLAYMLSTRADWALVYWDNFGMIFVKRIPEHATLIERYALSITHINDTIEATLRKIPEARIPELLREYTRVLERAPDAVLPRMRLGMFFQALGRCDLARDTWLPLTGSSIARGVAYRKLAECYDVLGDTAARDYARRMAHTHAGQSALWLGRP